ncbi:unnamed protein product [Phytophthora lilii]|uniref:Unnamed protein product n=1 Tax=Phytophthora lilii TaxID=2077276 RepID=A0A9W6WPW9_9STRA|nr:unnamed protein product [Phytophthora lilii]
MYAPSAKASTPPISGAEDDHVKDRVRRAVSATQNQVERQRGAPHRHHRNGGQTSHLEHHQALPNDDGDGGGTQCQSQEQRFAGCRSGVARDEAADCRLGTERDAEVEAYQQWQPDTQHISRGCQQVGELFGLVGVDEIKVVWGPGDGDEGAEAVNVDHDLQREQDDFK